jgi:hypothetical protein
MLQNNKPTNEIKDCSIQAQATSKNGNPKFKRFSVKKSKLNLTFLTVWV